MVAEITAPISLKNVLGYNFAKVKAGTASVILTSLMSVDENGKTDLSCFDGYGKPFAIRYSHQKACISLFD